MEDQEFKEKCRKLVFRSYLRDFPVVFEMYCRIFLLGTNIDEAMAEVVSIIRTSENPEVAYQIVCHYLDGLE